MTKAKKLADYLIPTIKITPSSGVGYWNVDMKCRHPENITAEKKRELKFLGQMYTRYHPTA